MRSRLYNMTINQTAINKNLVWMKLMNEESYSLPVNFSKVIYN